MKYLLNHSLFDEEVAVFHINNRAFQLGDFVSEFIKISGYKPLLMEEHYFNLMASMRILRLKIPNEFTQEFFEEKIQMVLEANQLKNARIKISIFRNNDFTNSLSHSEVSYLIKIDKIFKSSAYTWENQTDSEIDIYRDYTVNNSFFSQINSHKSEEIIAEIYRQENEYRDLILLNSEKRIARSLLGTPFFLQGDSLKTPKTTEGGIRSVSRNKLCQLLKRNPNFTFEETELFPFEIQKSDEVFVLIESEGIISFGKNRKKNYEITKTSWITELLNEELIDF